MSMTGPFATKPGRHGGGGQVLNAVAAASLQVSNARPDAAKFCTTEIQNKFRQRKTKNFKCSDLTDSVTVELL